MCPNVEMHFRQSSEKQYDDKRKTGFKSIGFCLSIELAYIFGLFSIILCNFELLLLSFQLLSSIETRVRSTAYVTQQRKEKRKKSSKLCIALKCIKFNVHELDTVVSERRLELMQPDDLCMEYANPVPMNAINSVAVCLICAVRLCRPSQWFGRGASVVLLALD